MKKTPFYELEEKEGAQFTEFAGYILPLHFGSAIEEAKKVREKSGFFNITHMGRIIIKGKDTKKFLLSIFTRINEEGEKKSKGKYGFIVSPEGEVYDDAISFLFKDMAIIIVNASAKEEDKNLFKRMMEELELDIEIKDISYETIFFAIQGPESENVVKELFGPEITELKRFEGKFLEENGFISRTGYTGEDGFEIFLFEKPDELWRKILKEREKGKIWLCGLAARDMLRLEAGLILYGLDVSKKHSFLNSPLQKFMDNKNFKGFENLMKKGEKTYLKRALLYSFPIPKPGEKVFQTGDKVFQNSKEIGFITSAVFSPITKKPIAFLRTIEDVSIGEKIKVGKKEIEGEIIGFSLKELIEKKIKSQ